ncbi:MAG: hypothetical protein ACT452_11860, partial [Microthrixaceae bacterium]
MSDRVASEAGARGELFEGVADAQALGEDEQVDRGAAGAAGVAVPALLAAGAGEEVHGRGGAGLRAVVGGGAGPAAASAGAQEFVGERVQVGAVEDLV